VEAVRNGANHGPKRKRQDISKRQLLSDDIHLRGSHIEASWHFSAGSAVQVKIGDNKERGALARHSIAHRRRIICKSVKALGGTKCPNLFPKVHSDRTIASQTEALAGQSPIGEEALTIIVGAHFTEDCLATSED